MRTRKTWNGRHKSRDIYARPAYLEGFGSGGHKCYVRGFTPLRFAWLRPVVNLPKLFPCPERFPVDLSFPRDLFPWMRYYIDGKRRRQSVGHSLVMNWKAAVDLPLKSPSSPLSFSSSYLFSRPPIVDALFVHHNISLALFMSFLTFPRQITRHPTFSRNHFFLGLLVYVSGRGKCSILSA